MLRRTSERGAAPGLVRSTAIPGLCLGAGLALLSRACNLPKSAVVEGRHCVGWCLLMVTAKRLWRGARKEAQGRNIDASKRTFERRRGRRALDGESRRARGGASRVGGGACD